jgi:hypothetical protein
MKPPFNAVPIALEHRFAHPSALTVNPFDHFDGHAIFLDTIEVALRGLADT